MFSTVCIPQHPALRLPFPSPLLSLLHPFTFSPSPPIPLPASFPHSLFLCHCDSCCVLCAKILLKVCHKSYPQFWLPQRIQGKARQGKASSRCHPQPVAAPSLTLPLFPSLLDLHFPCLSPASTRGGAYQLFRQINHKTSYRT